MCGEGNHQGLIVDTSVTRRTLLLAIGAVAAAGNVSTDAFAADPHALEVIRKGCVRRNFRRTRRCRIVLSRRSPAISGSSDVARYSWISAPYSAKWPSGLPPRAMSFWFQIPITGAKKAPVIEGAFDFNSKADTGQGHGLSPGSNRRNGRPRLQGLCQLSRFPGQNRSRAPCRSSGLLHERPACIQDGCRSPRPNWGGRDVSSRERSSPTSLRARTL